MRCDLEPDRLLTAYAVGIFPMADDEGEIRWFAPDPRAVIELDGLMVSRSLRAVLRRATLTVTINTRFDEVIRACANRPEGTWISEEILEAYTRLHQVGYAHSVESWHDDELVGIQEHEVGQTRLAERVGDRHADKQEDDQ